MTGYLMVKDDYKVGKKYSISNENSRIDGERTFITGFYYVFERLEDCIDAARRCGTYIDVVEVEMFSCAFCHNASRGRYFEGKEILIKEKINFMR